MISMDSHCVRVCRPCTLRAQIVYDLLVPRGKNTPKTGQTGFATNREVKGFEDGTLTYFDSLRFHSILRDNPIIYDNPLSSTACAVFFFTCL